MLLSNPTGLNGPLLYPSPQSLHPYIQQKAGFRNGQIRLPGQFLPVDEIVPYIQRLNPYNRLRSTQFLIPLIFFISFTITGMRTISRPDSFCCKLQPTILTNLGKSNITTHGGVLVFASVEKGAFKSD
jgi:hypothetical protein